MDWQMIYITKLEGCENSTQARHSQFVHLKYIKDLRMHSKTEKVVVQIYFLGGQ